MSCTHLIKIYHERLDWPVEKESSLIMKLASLLMNERK